MEDCAKLNSAYPEYAPGWHTSSLLALQINRPKTALAAIDKALAAQPETVDWLLQKGACLLKLARFDELNALLEKLCGSRFKTAYQYSAIGMLLSEVGKRESAVPYYEKATRVEPGEAKHYFNLACLQRSLGQIGPAESNFVKTIELDPQAYEAYKLRSDLRRQTEEDNHVKALQALLADGIDDPRGKAHVCYALAKELEDLERYDSSFDALQEGAALRRGLMRYEVQRDLDTITAIQNTFDAGVFDNGGGGFDNAEAIFVLGMPRTGTTLVERILASHGDVIAAGELNNFAMVLTSLLHRSNEGQKLDRNQMVALSARLDFAALGESYLQSTRPFTGNSERFIDKMPLNYLYVGLIHLALPKAKIINLQRHPMDTCYAVYKQLFVDAYPFSYQLEELGRYFVAYHQLMEHWNAVLPGVIHTVNYETLVNDTAAEARRLLDYCELDWTPDVLKFHENRAASTTASTTQIRQPVYRSSVGKWRHYEARLEPVKRILAEAGIDLSQPK